jgi:replication fork clamp-binding protein CrfC
MKKKKLLKKRFYDKTLVYKVKAIFDYKEFKKGELYEIDVDSYYDKDKKLCFFVIPENYFPKLSNMKVLDEIINKFELVDNIREQRRKKLKRLKKCSKNIFLF